MHGCKRIKNGPFLTATFLLLSSQPASAICTVNTTSVQFGSYDVFLAAPTQTTGTVSVSCTPTTPFTIALNGGLHGTPSQRALLKAGSNETLLYNLYTNPSYSIVWGDGTASTATVAGTSSSPIQIYGMVAGQQDVSVGIYTDSVTVTVTY